MHTFTPYMLMKDNFGAGAKTATKQVQLAAGITTDGLAGPQTIRACYVLAAK